MLINLNLLPKVIDSEFVIPENIYKNSSVVKLDPVKVVGNIKYNLSDEVEIELDCKGCMYLMDAISGDEIKHEFFIKIDEVLSDSDKKMAKYYEKCQNTLDIIEFLWENIVLEVPIRVTNFSGTQMHGNGWNLNGDFE